VKIAIIDTGIDYTHANFGGPGTAAAYTAHTRRRLRRPNPALFGPNAPRIKGALISSATAINADPSSPASSRFRTRIRIRSTATATARTWPAPPPAPGSPRRRNLHRPLQRSDARDAERFKRRPRVAPKADL